MVSNPGSGAIVAVNKMVSVTVSLVTVMIPAAALSPVKVIVTISDDAVWGSVVGVTMKLLLLLAIEMGAVK